MALLDSLCTKPQPSIDAAAYRNFNQQTVRKGSYLPVRRDLARILGPSGAILFTHIVNVGQASADASGWVMMTPAFIERGTGIPSHRQNKVLWRLQELGVIQVEHRGNRRHIRAVISKVNELLKG